MLEAIDALHSAALADGDEGLELVDAVSNVGNGYSYLLAAGAMPAVARDVPPSLSAQEAARRASAVLCKAVDICDGGDVAEDKLLAAVELGAAVRFLDGWL